MIQDFPTKDDIKLTLFNVMNSIKSILDKELPSIDPKFLELLTVVHDAIYTIKCAEESKE